MSKGTVGISATLGIFLALLGVARAEVMFNFPLENNAAASREASGTLLASVGTFVYALQMVEKGDSKGAQAYLEKGIYMLGQTRGLFENVEKLVAVKKIDRSKVKLGGDVLTRIVDEYKIELPTTTGGLARLSIAEVDLFSSQMKEAKLTDPQSAQASTLILSRSLKRLMDVGVLVSALAEASNP